MIRLFLSAVVLALAFSATPLPAADPIVLSEEEGRREGAALVDRMLSMAPDSDSETSGILTRRQQRVTTPPIPVHFRIQTRESNWASIYHAPTLTNGLTRLTVVRSPGNTNRYEVVENGKEKILSGNETMAPFAGTDFWVVDLGLDFLFWPHQRVLQKEIRRGQSCSVLESVNPNPSADGYARVLSWVDIDTGGIINAEAYGNGGRRIKEFAAKSFKKVNGRWELKEIEMSDRRTGSRTTLTFDLGTR